MTKTGIIALLIVIAAIFTIGVVGFITTPPQDPAVEMTPGPTIQENVASPAPASPRGEAVATPQPSSALPSEEARLQTPGASATGGQATPSAQRVEVMISSYLSGQLL